MSSIALGSNDDDAVARQDLDIIGAFTEFFDSSTCVHKGLCPVTKIRHQQLDVLPPQSHSLYFEQHGTGPEKLLFITGLNSSMFGWKEQVDYFGSHGGYSVLVFDNRGVGNSGTPKGPYTTSGMAEDVIVLLDSMGWTEPRSVHVVGMSLGGMIAQELATRIPDRIISLMLAVTTPGGRVWNNFPSWRGVVALTRLLAVSDPAIKIPILLDVSYPASWLDAPANNDKKGRTNRQVQTELYRHRIASTRRQTLVGSVSQMCAALTHYVSPVRLRSIALDVSRVTVVTGDEDWMVHPSGSERVWEALVSEDARTEVGRKVLAFGGVLGDVELVRWEGTGHPIHLQWPERFNELLERMVKDARERIDAIDATTQDI